MEKPSIYRLSPVTRFIFCRIFPLPFLIIGALALHSGCKDLLQAIDSKTWPTAEGVIQQSTIEHHEDNKSSGTYHANVRYDFEVNGITYSSNRVNFGSIGTSSSSYARRIANEFLINFAVNLSNLFKLTFLSNSFSPKEICCMRFARRFIL